MKKHKQGFTLVEIMIVVAIIGLLAAIGIPSFIKAREKSLLNTKTANTKQISGAIEQYALDNSKSTGDTIGWSDLAAYLKDDNMNNYNVGGEMLDDSTFTVGGDVAYKAQ
jgi:prepilin-type N-terminal cleavage/methylation domain-containing protein